MMQRLPELLSMQYKNQMRVIAKSYECRKNTVNYSDKSIIMQFDKRTMNYSEKTIGKNYELGFYRKLSASKKTS